MRDFPDLPPVWLLFNAILVWVLGWVCPIANIGGPVATALAWILGIAGLVMGVWSAFYFWRKKTTIEPRHRPKTLIVEGPYRVSRNPIYLAMLLLLLAEALWLGPLAGFIAVVFQWAVLRQRFILGEETTLRNTFGDEAESYIAKTRRWF